MSARSTGLPGRTSVYIQYSLPHHGERNGYLRRSMYIRRCVSWRLEHGYGLLPYG